jgi:HNH endonuclease
MNNWRKGRIKKFWNRLNKDGPIQPNMTTKCWEWTGTRNNTNYGLTSLDCKQMGAHRAAWILMYGEIPEGINVCHTCDNPPCCNPEHLFLGTQSDNIKDMYDKGKRKKILLSRKLEIIKFHLDNPSKKIKELAIIFNLSCSAIYKLLRIIE